MHQRSKRLPVQQCVVRFEGRAVLSVELSSRGVPHEVVRVADGEVEPAQGEPVRQVVGLGVGRLGQAELGALLELDRAAVERDEVRCVSRVEGEERCDQGTVRVRRREGGLVLAPDRVEVDTVDRCGEKVSPSEDSATHDGLQR